MSGRNLHAVLGVALLGLLKVTGFQVRAESLGNTKVDTFLQFGLFCFMRWALLHFSGHAVGLQFFPIMRGPKLNTALEVWSHHSWVQGDNNLHALVSGAQCQHKRQWAETGGQEALPEYQYFYDVWVSGALAQVVQNGCGVTSFKIFKSSLTEHGWDQLASRDFFQPLLSVSVILWDVYTSNSDFLGCSITCSARLLHKSASLLPFNFFHYMVAVSLRW